MVRRLFLMRHGKAAWPEGVPDHERPLAPRGIATVPKMAEKLKGLAEEFDLALISDAKRTRQTFAGIKTVIPGLEPRFMPEIYEAQPGALLDVVQSLPIFARNVLMVGHNPGLQSLALYLASRTPCVASNVSSRRRASFISNSPFRGMRSIPDGHGSSISSRRA